MSLVRTFQVFLGILFGLVVLAGAGAAAGYYFLSRLNTTPPKPIFSEERPQESSDSQANTPPAPSVKTETAVPLVKAETSEGDAQKSEETSSQKTEELEPGAYKARVTWSEGLSLRDGPNLEANRIGGIGYQEELIVIKESEDGKWQQVRTPGSDRQGWVKAGNVEKLGDDL